MSWKSSRRSSTAARRSSSRTGHPPFSRKRGRNHSAGQDRISYLEKKIQTQDEVLAELMTEHVALTKRLVGGSVGKWKFRIATGTSARAGGNDNAGSQSRAVDIDIVQLRLEFRDFQFVTWGHLPSARPYNRKPSPASTTVAVTK